MLICTGLTDRPSVSLVEKTLAARGRQVLVYRKGEDDLGELYKSFAHLTGNSVGSGLPTPARIVPWGMAFVGMLLLHSLLLLSIILVANMIPDDADPALKYSAIGLITFSGSLAALLVFWGVKAVTRRDVSEVFKMTVAAFLRLGHGEGPRRKPGRAHKEGRTGG